MDWALVLLPFMVLVGVMSAALRGLRQVVKALAVESLFRPFLALAGIGLLFSLYPWTRLPQYAMVVQLCAGALVLCAAVFLLLQYLPKQARAASARFQGREWLASAMPLTLIGGAGIINSQTDILMLGFFQDPGAVGIYRVAAQGAALVAFGLQAANAVIAPQFARLYAKQDMARLQRLVTASARAILLVSLPVATVFVLFGGILAGWVFGPEFVKSQAPLAILAAGQLVNVAMGSVGFLLNMTGHEGDVARTLLITAGMNIILNLVLIPPFGMAGAAIATTISLASWNIMLHVAVRRRIGINSTAFVK